MSPETAATRIVDALKKNPDILGRVLDILTEVEEPKYEYHNTLHMEELDKLGKAGWRLVCTAASGQATRFYLERRVR